jgi:hypothetical protein
MLSCALCALLLQASSSELEKIWQEAVKDVVVAEALEQAAQVGAALPRCWDLSLSSSCSHNGTSWHADDRVAEPCTDALVAVSAGGGG